MKAILIKSFGGPSVLQLVDVATPAPGAREVLIRVGAAGVNFADTMQRSGVYPLPTLLPAVMGGEVAGTVAAIGEEVEHLRPGDRVAAFTGGGYAEYALAPAGQVFTLPAGLDFPVATALLVQGLTAQRLVNSVPFGSVLIHAAAGGVGSLAVQLARRKGARVIGLASGPEKRAWLEKLGADAVVDYTREQWTEKVLAATGGAGVDLVLETTGGSAGTRNVACLAPGGTMIVFGATSGQPTLINAQELIFKKLTVRGISLYGESGNNWATGGVN
jgi:NADPH2:quinone reductase